MRGASGIDRPASTTVCHFWVLDSFQRSRDLPSADGGFGYIQTMATGCMLYRNFHVVCVWMTKPCACHGFWLANWCQHCVPQHALVASWLTHSDDIINLSCKKTSSRVSRRQPWTIIPPYALHSQYPSCQRPNWTEQIWRQPCRPL